MGGRTRAYKVEGGIIVGDDTEVWIVNIAELVTRLVSSRKWSKSGKAAIYPTRFKIPYS